MRGVAALALLLANVHLGRPCEKVEKVLVCLKIPSYFDPGCSSLLMLLKNVGEVNSSVFHSDSLASIDSLTINNANITRIAESGFGSFPHLATVTLTGNMLSQVNADWFGNPAVLRELNVADNRIEGVTEFALNGLTNLTKLKLNKNRIQTIHPSSFRSQSALAEVDLSENRLTWVPPQIFTSLGSLGSIRLDGNPWNCSCAHKDFVASVKELRSRSQLDRGMDVTCETPPPLKGQPVWDVSACPTSPPAGPPTEGLTAVPTPTANVGTIHPSRLTSKAKTSTVSSHTAALSSTESPGGTKPTGTTLPLKTGTFVTSPLSGTRTSAHFRPPNTSVTVSKTTAATESVPAQPSDTNITCTLSAVIAVLCVLLLVVCFLAALHRRHRSSKAVMPGCVTEERRREPEEGDGSSQERRPGRSEDGDPEVDLKREFAGVRAKSANAVILTSPFGFSEKDEVTFQTETEVKLEVCEGKQKPVAESEVAAGGGIQMDGDTTTDTMKECEIRDAGNLDQKPECIYANTDLVPYLSIGTSQKKDEESTEGPKQRSQMGKVMGRVSTWPPTAAQWQARCKIKEEEEEGGLAVWTQNEPVKLSDEEEKVSNKMKHPSGSERCDKEEETEKSPTSAPINLRHCLPSQPNEDTHTGSTSEEQLKEGTILHPAAATPTRNEISQTQELESAEDPAHKSSSKTEARKGQRLSATGRQRADNRAAASKAPSGGTSPDDETLLSGNEYAFMDLLQEVAQNNGRWTRDRWKQVHANKQRR